MNDTTHDVSSPDETTADDTTTPELSAEQARNQAAPADAAATGTGAQDAQPAPEADAAEADAQSADSADEADGDDAGEGDGPADGSAESTEDRMRRLEEEGDIAADYLEELLDIADLDGDIDIDVDGDRASVEIAGADQLARMNRPKGELLDALQELARLAVQTRTGNRSRLMLDIGGFRAEHKDSLEELAAKAVAEAKESGAPVPLRPMNPFERKVVHDVAKRESLRSESDGDGKDRHVVIYPAS